MASNRKPKYLPFPIFGLCFYKDKVLITGGGGGKKFAIQNKLLVFYPQTMEQVKELDTGEELLVSIQYIPGLDFLVGALARDIVFYKISNNLSINVVSRTESEKVKNLNIVKVFENETKILTAGEEGIIGLWTLEKTGKASRVLKVCAGTEVFACDCNGSIICAALKNQFCGIFSAKTGQKLKTLYTSDKPTSNFMIRHCVFTGKDLLTLSTSKNSSYLTRWDLNDNFAPTDSIKVSDTSAAVLKVSKSNRLAAVGVSDGSISVISLKTFSVQCTRKEFEMPATCFDFNAKETALMVGSADYSYSYIQLSSYPWYWLLFISGFVGLLSLVLA